MCAMPQPNTMSEEQYLEFERNSDIKHEFFQGEIFALSGVSTNHDRIVASVVYHLYGQISNSACEVLTSDMRLKVSAVGLFTYPDVKIICGNPQLTDDKPPSLLDATVIIEVRSPSTEKYDRTKKFQYYRTLESFQEYLLISQDTINVQRFHKKGDDWIFTDASELEDTITLASVDCTLALADIYHKVEFEPEEQVKNNTQ